MTDESYFRQLMREHLGRTRAGPNGQFDHSLTLLGGSDAAKKIVPGETYEFSAETLAGSPITVEVTNNSTGPSGRGWQSQDVAPGGTTVVCGDDPATGQATIVFNVADTFTSEVTTGRIQAVAAVKFKGSDITAIYWNSPWETDQFDVTTWADGDGGYGEWVYNSAL